MYYGDILYKKMGFSPFASSVPLPIIYYMVNCLMTFPGMYLIERLGRRKLLAYGGFLMAISHSLVCLWLNLGKSSGNSMYYYLAYANVLTFDMGFASTWGPVVWAYQSEIFPLRVRGKATGLSTMSNWLNNAIIAFVAPIITENLNEQFYLVFASTAFAMGVFAYFFVPETMGKSLEEMDEIFGSSGDMAKMEMAASGGKVRKAVAGGH
jgi:SP family sugar:H+ symporter-like MFS transporter